MHVEQETKCVFLSYSTHDLPVVTEIRDYLESNQISCWIGNRDIYPGKNYTEEISFAINQCAVFVLILSENSQKSQYVLSELECARAAKKVIIPYVLDKSPVVDRIWFHLRTYQMVLAYEEGQCAKETLLNGILKTLEEVSKIENESPGITEPAGVQCPVCKSHDLTSNDPMMELFSMAASYATLRDKVVKISCVLILVLLIMVFLYEIPGILLPTLAEWILTSVPLISEVVSEDGQIVTMQLVKICGLTILLCIPFALVSTCFDMLRAYYYKRVVQTGIYRVKYICKDCRTKFTVLHSLDMLNQQKSKIKNNVTSGAYAIMHIIAMILVTILFLPIILIIPVGFCLGITLGFLYHLKQNEGKINWNNLKEELRIATEDFLHGLFSFPDLSPVSESSNENN